MASSFSLRKLFFLAGVGMLLFIVIMKTVMLPLRSGEIVSFELAKDVDKASKIMTAWSIDPAGRLDKVNTAIRLDFIFILLYSVFFFLGTRFMGNLAENPVLQKAGRGFSWIILLAGVCDVVENISMMLTLASAPRAWIVRLTYDMAVIKFSILMIAAFFMIISFIIWMTKKPGGEGIKGGAARDYTH